jgi:hypothetical protein
MAWRLHQTIAASSVKQRFASLIAHALEVRHRANIQLASSFGAYALGDSPSHRSRFSLMADDKS